jgi:hypothetical protein
MEQTNKALGELSINIEGCFLKSFFQTKVFAMTARYVGLIFVSLHPPHILLQLRLWGQHGQDALQVIFLIFFFLQRKKLSLFVQGFPYCGFEQLVDFC